VRAARTRVDLAPGPRATATLALSRTARRLLARRGRVRGLVAALNADGAGGTPSRAAVTVLRRR
jgi:hypothetical protein